MAGHLFIVHGDLTAIACDAIFIPTDEYFSLTASWDSLGLSHPDRGWDGQAVIRHRTEPGEPELWYGNIGQPGNDSEFAVFEPAIEQFVKRAKEEIDPHREGRICAWPNLRLGLNVVGSGEGGARRNKGELIYGLVKLLRSLAAAHGVDIIFSTFGEKGYAAAQRARRQLLMAERDSPSPQLAESDLRREWKFAEFASGELTAHAMDLAEVAMGNQLVLFIGAGSSADAGVPTWRGLLRRVANKAGVDDGYLELLKERDLRDWATLIDRKMPEGASIHELVADEIKQHERYSLQHALLASLPSNEAVTTNFDQLFERASRVADRDLSVLPMHPGRSTSAWLLKLHGSVDDPSKMVLTRSDYLNMPRNRGALMGLVQGLLLTRHMLYVGYSLSDEDFHELVHEVRAAAGDASGRGATLITLAADRTQEDLWRDELKIVTMGLNPNEKSGPRLLEAARHVDIFLDLVGFWSTTSVPFFLDSDYSKLSDDDNAVLRSKLNDVASVISRLPNDTVAKQVRKHLLDLGLQEGSGEGPSYTERFTQSDISGDRIRIRSNRLPRLAGDLELDIRGTVVGGRWEPNGRAQLCGVLRLYDSRRLAALVEPGERLKITGGAGGIPLELH